MTTKTLASSGQSKYTSGYTLGSTSNLTITGVTLINHGTVGASAAQWGIEIYGTGNTVINYGLVEPSASTYPSAGVAFASGSGNVLINKMGATLSSGYGGGFYTGSDSSGHAPNSTLINGGIILGNPAKKPAQPAVVMEDSGVITNLSTGTIEGNGVEFYNGYISSGSTPTSNISLVNSGQILGGPNYGALFLRNGGDITNLAGTISGNGSGLYGISIANKNSLNVPSTITNAATIEGGAGAYAIVMAAVAGNRIIDQVGGVFIGQVNGGTNATMELSSAASAGILSATGGQFTHFSALNIDAGARWTIEGDGSLSTEFPKIGGFTVGDTISLSGLSQTPTTFASSVSTISGTTQTSVTIKAGTIALETLTLLGSIASGSFAFAAGLTSTLTEPVGCFVTGTRIATVDGPREVEALRIGDLVMTLAGEARPIRWIGQRFVNPRHHPRPDKVYPLCIGPDTFGPGQPKRVLFVSPDHGIRVPDIDNGAAVLVPAGLLANGDGIAAVDLGSFTYWHVELATHDIILAEGLPVESYLATGNRDNFEDGALMRLYPDFSPSSSALRWEAAGCLRLVLAGPLLDAARRLADRATTTGRHVRPPRSAHVAIDGTETTTAHDR